MTSEDVSIWNDQRHCRGLCPCSGQSRALCSESCPEWVFCCVCHCPLQFTVNHARIFGVTGVGELRLTVPFEQGDGGEFGLVTRFLNSPRLQKSLPCHPHHVKSYLVLEVLKWSEGAVCTCGVECATQHATQIFTTHSHFPAQLFLFVSEEHSHSGCQQAQCLPMSFFVVVSTMQTCPWFLADSSHVRHRAGGWTVLSSVELR